MVKFKSGTCGVCGQKNVPLRGVGKLDNHVIKNLRMSHQGEICPGTGEKPVEARRPSTGHDKEILDGIPRGVWADLWATEQEEKGRSFSGQELTSIAPKTPAWAKKWALKVADDIVRLNGKSLDELYEMVTDRELDRPFPHDKDQFGLLLGMQAVGHGISWSDDVRGLSHDAIELPHTEFYR